MSGQPGARGRRRGGPGVGALAALLAPAVAGLVLLPVTPAAAVDPFALAFSARGTDGVGRISTPGRPCAEGGDGAYWHYDYSAPLAGRTSAGPGVFSALPGELRLHVDLHSEQGETRVTPAGQAAPPPSPQPSAFLLAEESHASLINERGTVKLRLRSGECARDKLTLAFDGVTASGPGTWSVDPNAATGAYRQATGNGTFGLTAAVAPGADNPFDLRLDGKIEVLKPSLKVEVADVYWGFLGADYLLRRVTVVYRVTNAGPGDAFAARFVDAASSTTDVTFLGPANQPLGDLLAGESELVKVRYRLGPGNPPCALVILGCQFDTRVKVDLPDALDRPAQTSAAPTGGRCQPARDGCVRAPDFPPPL